MKLFLNQESRKSVEKQTGLSVDQIISMDIEDIDMMIEKKIRKKLTFQVHNDMRLFGRGSVYLFLNRLFAFDNLKTDKRIKSM
ncbi:MAG: hypothetical protein E7068_01555 [Lentimicrobiaceae bacterium]|nr:hypothetical protein [Lentimicrobiaceae bacterium]